MGGGRPAAASSRDWLNCAALGRAVDGDAIEFHTVINEPEPKLFDIDQMIVMRLRCGLVSLATVTEIMALKYTGLFKQANGAIDRGNRNARIDRGRP